MDLTSLIGKSLEGFTLRELTEVYRVNEDGRKMVSTGFFRDENVAKAFAANEPDGEPYNKTCKHFVLTDGKEGFLIEEAVTLLDDEQTALKIREAALAKLSAAERAVLKI